MIPILQLFSSTSPYPTSLTLNPQLAKSIFKKKSTPEINIAACQEAGPLKLIWTNPTVSSAMLDFRKKNPPQLFLLKQAS